MRKSMSILLAILVICPAMASAEVLVRHCDAPTATACATTSIWVRPASAINVQVNRSGAPFVKLSDVLPTERVASCYHDSAVAVGSSTKCNTRVPGRNDLWEMKSVLYPPAQVVGQITVVWDAVTEDSDGQSFDGTAGYLLYRQQDVCGETSADSRCGQMPWETDDVGPATRRIYTGISGRWCFTVQGYTVARDLGVITVPDPSACAVAGQVIRLPGAAKNVRAVGP
jgi:hypothetical protein